MAPDSNASVAQHNFIVIGAGYAGLAASIELARRGYAVEVFESTKELTNQGNALHSHKRYTTAHQLQEMSFRLVRTQRY